jgi:SAM-dependent methyltransferase
MTKNDMRPSLETLIESEDLGLEVLHPGGPEITKELAELCHIGRGTIVLDVASGTGESACYLVQNLGCQVTGVDISDQLIKRAKRKAIERGLIIEFKKGDAHDLPFDDNTFDAVISECTTSLLDKDKAIREMVRVAKPSGYVGIHDIYWKEGTPESLKERLQEIEGERPETLEGWKNLFMNEGLGDVITVDRSYLIQDWEKNIRKEIGILTQLKIFLSIIKKWGFGSFRNILESMKIFQSQHIGYGIIVGKKS